VTISVSIVQRTDPAVVGNSGTTAFSPANNEWMFLMAAGTLKPGTARAHGEAIPVGGGAPLNEWDQTVVLAPAALS